MSRVQQREEENAGGVRGAGVHVEICPLPPSTVHGTHPSSYSRSGLDKVSVAVYSRFPLTLRISSLYISPRRVQYVCTSTVSVSSTGASGTDLYQLLALTTR